MVYLTRLEATMTDAQTPTRPRSLWSRDVRDGITLVALATGLTVAVTIAGCSVSNSSSPRSSSSPGAASVVKLTDRRCAIQTIGLLTAAQLPPHMTAQWPATSFLGAIGPYHDLGGGGPFYPGSIGRADGDFRWTGFPSQPLQGVPANGSLYVSHPTQVFQLIEEIDDWGTVANATRWMAGQRGSNTLNTIPDYGNGVERVVSVPATGDDAFMYQIDEGAAYNSTPHTGPYVGHIYTDIGVRLGALMFALSIDSGPDANPASLAVSLARSLMAKEQAVCG